MKWNLNPIYSLLKLNDFSLLFGTLLLTTLIVLFIIKYTNNLKVNFKRKNELPKEDGNLEYGSSRWATDNEIKNNFKIWDMGKDLSIGGIPVTHLNNKCYYCDSFNHSLIIGSTGSGKTLCEIMPLIFNLGYADESMIINDTKGELYSTTSNFLKKEDII